MSTCYRIVCERHTQRVVLVDVTCDPSQETSDRYERQMQRWDRHVIGEEPILDRLGNPYPPDFRPYLHRHSSNKITVVEHPYVFVPELVDKCGPNVVSTEDILALMTERVEAILNGHAPRPYDGYVRTTDHGMSDSEHADGHTIRIGCQLCMTVNQNAQTAEASADTLAMVLDRISASLDTLSLPVLDDSEKPTGETVQVRVLPLTTLCNQLGNSPRG
jgi:hypothetical protein